MIAPNVRTPTNLTNIVSYNPTTYTIHSLSTTCPYSISFKITLSHQSLYSPQYGSHIHATSTLVSY